jgi:DNA-binding MltR family transcriptional regulator
MEGFPMDKLDESFFQNLRVALEERSKPFGIALEQGSDRSIAIISGCLLDNLLERLIRAFYVKDPSVKMLFKNDHILQSFFAKINIAYFSGLIPKVIYHDLKLICEIRNKFAHEVTANLNFNSNVISQRINSCEIRPKTMDDTPAYRIKFIIIIQQLIDHLCYFEHLLLHSKPPNLVESFKLNDRKWGEAALTKEQIYDIMSKNVSSTKSS